MSRLIEDFLTDQERDAISAVLEKNDIRFSVLAAIAGLNPAEDFKYSDLRFLNFCGADLRGFDFTGSDLRGSIRDGETKIDDTTIFHDALVEWVSAEDAPIVEFMMRVQGASSSAARKSCLDELEKKFGKSNHVVAFVINAAAKAESAYEFLDYVEFLPQELTPDLRTKVIDAGLRALNRRFAQSRARTRREATVSMSANKIAERLSEARNSFAAEWFTSLAEHVSGKPMNGALKGVFGSLDKQDLIHALKRLRS